MSTWNNKKMLVSDVMLGVDCVPVVKEKTILKAALEEMGRKHLGIACVVDEKNEAFGILTDGDIRRMLLRVQKPFSAFFVDDVVDHAIRSPLTVLPDVTLRKAVRLMDEKHVWDMPVVDASDTLIGLLHLHPAVEALLEIVEN